MMSLLHSSAAGAAMQMPLARPESSDRSAGERDRRRLRAMAPALARCRSRPREASRLATASRGARRERCAVRGVSRRSVARREGRHRCRRGSRAGRWARIDGAAGRPRFRGHRPHAADAALLPSVGLRCRDRSGRRPDPSIPRSVQGGARPRPDRCGAWRAAVRRGVMAIVVVAHARP